MNVIDLQKVLYKYKKNNNFYLKADNIQIPSGKITALLGESGGGKSTLLDILGCIINPFDNRIGYADKADIEFLVRGNKHSIQYLWNNEKFLNKIKLVSFGYMFQNSFFLPEINLKENVGISLLFNGNESNNSEIADYFNKVKDSPLFSSNIDKKLGSDLAKNCSGGQKQRFALFRSLAHDPEVLFLDEPTGDLDPKSARLVFRELEEWMRNNESGNQKTIVLVTHDLYSAYEFADIIYYISGSEVNSSSQFIKNDNKWRKNGEKETYSLDRMRSTIYSNDK